MSLINQVLQDLDQRSSDTGRALPFTNAANEKANQSQHLKKWIVIVAVVLAANWLLVSIYGGDFAQWMTKTGSQGDAVVQHVVVPKAEPQTPEETKADEPLVLQAPQKNINTDAKAPDVISKVSADKPPVVRKVMAIKTEKTIPAIADDAEWFPKEQNLEPEPQPVIHVKPIVNKPKHIQINRVRNPYKAQLDEALALVDSGKLVKAEPFLEQLVKQYPDKVEPAELLVGLYMRDGRDAKAGALIQNALSIDPGNANLALIQAQLMLDKGTVKKAIDVLMPQMKQEQPSVSVMQMLGALLQQSGRYMEAVKVYDKLVLSNPAVSSSWLGLAIALDELKRKGADTAYERSLRLGGLDAKAATYAQQRLVALKGGQ